MNETINTLINRRSCRKFKSDMVSEDLINEVIKAGVYAPTGKGKQSPIIIAITNKKIRDELSKINKEVMGITEESYDPFYNAPVVLVVLADKNVFTYINDGSLVLGNMLNACASLGLGSIWIHRAKEEFETEYGKKLLKDLGVEGDYVGIGQVCLGYKDVVDNVPAKRKDNYVYYVK